MKRNNRNQALEDKQASIVAEDVIDKMHRAATKGGSQVRTNSYL